MIGDCPQSGCGGSGGQSDIVCTGGVGAGGQIVIIVFAVGIAADEIEVTGSSILDNCEFLHSARCSESNSIVADSNSFAGKFIIAATGIIGQCLGHALPLAVVSNNQHPAGVKGGKGVFREKLVNTGITIGFASDPSIQCFQGYIAGNGIFPGLKEFNIGSVNDIFCNPTCEDIVLSVGKKGAGGGGEGDLRAVKCGNRIDRVNTFRNGEVYRVGRELIAAVAANAGFGIVVMSDCGNGIGVTVIAVRAGIGGIAVCGAGCVLMCSLLVVVSKCCDCFILCGVAARTFIVDVACGGAGCFRSGSFHIVVTLKDGSAGRYNCAAIQADLIAGIAVGGAGCCHIPLKLGVGVGAGVGKEVYVEFVACAGIGLIRQRIMLNGAGAINAERSGRTDTNMESICVTNGFCTLRSRPSAGGFAGRERR